jgi:acylphosphatase
MLRRETIFFSGRVQGVGFRFSANAIAQRLQVKGTVENLDDGRVKIIVEAEPAEIDSLLIAIQTSMPGHVHKIDRFESEPSFEFENFSVRR